MIGWFNRFIFSEIFWCLEVWSFCGSLMIPVTTLCIVIFAERQAQILLAKPNLLSERNSLNVKVLFIIIKHKKNVYWIWNQQKPIPQLSIFCLIQGIINYVQIDTYWSCIVRIGIFINLANNILLLASKNCFLTRMTFTDKHFQLQSLTGSYI
jgi:hypothetical protein